MELTWQRSTFSFLSVVVIGDLIESDTLLNHILRSNISQHLPMNNGTMCFLCLLGMHYAVWFKKKKLFKYSFTRFSKCLYQTCKKFKSLWLYQEKKQIFFHLKMETKCLLHHSKNCWEFWSLVMRFCCLASSWHPDVKMWLSWRELVGYKVENVFLWNILLLIHVSDVCLCLGSLQLINVSIWNKML